MIRFCGKEEYFLGKQNYDLFFNKNCPREFLCAATCVLPRYCENEWYSVVGGGGGGGGSVPLDGDE